MPNLRERLARGLHRPVAGRLCFTALTLLGVELPRTVHIGQGLQLPHGAFGLVVHESTAIGAGVKIFQGVTIGRADQYLEVVPKGGRAVIGDEVVLGAGSKVLFKAGRTLTVGDRAVIGANAVVTTDVPADEIWAGIPARRVGRRTPASPPDVLNEPS